MNKTLNPRDILLRPVISEKSLRLADDGKYTFIVAPGTHKIQIRQAVEASFNVKVTGVNTLNRQGNDRGTQYRSAVFYHTQEQRRVAEEHKQKLDAARVFRLALERGATGGPYHAVAEEGVPFKDIAEVIGRRLDLPVETVPLETYGPLGPIFDIDQPASSTHTRKTLGWEPTHPSLLEDLENIQP